jgi:tRNA pseudouridine55 synthase
LPIALGKATRLLQFFKAEKAYRATMQLGVSTTTDDLEGEIIASVPASGLSLEQTASALKLFEGKIQQVPPSYSAIQVQGKRLYDLARAGEKVEVPTRTVEVFKIEILDWRPGDFPELDVAIACGSGTYIRAIARDLGALLQTGGTLAALTRTQSSEFYLSDSLTFDELEAQLQQGTFHPIPPTVALHHLGTVTLPATVAQRWRQGQRVPWNAALPGSTNSPLRVYQEGERFLGIGHLVNSDAGQLLIPQIVFEQA